MDDKKAEISYFPKKNLLSVAIVVFLLFIGFYFKGKIIMQTDFRYATDAEKRIMEDFYGINSDTISRGYLIDAKLVAYDGSTNGYMIEYIFKTDSKVDFSIYVYNLEKKSVGFRLENTAKSVVDRYGYVHGICLMDKEKSFVTDRYIRYCNVSVDSIDRKSVV